MQIYWSRWLPEAARWTTRRKRALMTTLPQATSLQALRQKLGDRLKINLNLPGFSSLQRKLIIPYVLLTLVLATVGVYVVTRLVTTTIRERFVNQIYEAARVSADLVVRQERSHLENLRLMAYTQGVGDALRGKDTASLEALLLPLALNSGVETVSVVDADGIELLTLGVDPVSHQYLRASGTDLSAYPLVTNVLQGVQDDLGDKFVGLVETNFGPGLFSSSAVWDAEGRLVGVLLVGTRLETLLNGIKSQALADLVFFDQNLELLAATLPAEEAAYAGLGEAVRQASTRSDSQTYDILLSNRDYQVTFTPFKARQEQLGWLGVILPSSYVVAAEATSRNTFSLIFTAGTLGVIVIGLVLSRNIARPILKLRNFTQEVAAGNLDQQMALSRSDEIGELAGAFDVMTLRLRERTREAERLYAEAVQRNRELVETNQQLRTTQMQLVQSEKLAAVGQLTAGIVHDVKNPLTVIKGMAELMLTEGELPGDLVDEISLIRDSALKANTILSDLLTFARQSTPELTERDMRDTVEAALRLTAFPLRKGHIQVTKELPEQALMMVYDNQQIEQVLVNLITNAIQAMPDGGKLGIRLSQSGEMAAIAVQDSGMGIPAENINRIFDPFFTTKPEGEGTGLGLSVGYGIISNHNGRIEVQSPPGEGTTFTILLPVAASGDREHQPWKT